MQQPDLTRRQVLSGIAVTGGAGAITGRETAALFTDEETFTNNALTASTSSAGVVELDVTVDSLDNGDGLTYTISVPDLTNNNPSYIWVQPATCPEPIDGAEQVDVELRIDRDGGGDGVVIADGTLKSVINEFRESGGASLPYVDGDARCFEPGESVDLVLEVISSETDEEFGFTLEFYAEQCRYDPGTSSPFEQLAPCGSESAGDNGISFISFCSESGGALEPRIFNETDPDEDGAPTSAEWETESDVEYVVLKSGQYFTIYDYRDETITGGTVTTGGDDDALYTDEPSNSRSSAPCELAAEEFGADPAKIETSVKLEFEGGTFVREGGDGSGDGVDSDGGDSNSGSNGSGSNGSGSNGNEHLDPAGLRNSL